MALCHSSGTWRKKGNPSRCSDACPRGEVLPLCFWQDPTEISVQRSIEENISGAGREGETTWLTALTDGQLMPSG